MKLIKVQPEHFIVVDNTNIDMGDFIFEVSNREITEANDEWNGEESNDEWKKIIYSTQPLDGVELISLSEVRELIGEVDVESIAEKTADALQWDFEDPCGSGYSDFIDGFVNGYNKAIENKKYTEEDLRKAVDMARDIADDSAHDTFTVDDITGCTEICTYGWREKYSNEKIIQHIQPKTEWDVEFVDGKIKLI
jgi:hypothetical protein